MTVSEKLRPRIKAHGVRVYAMPMGFETSGVFDGLGISSTTAYDQEPRCHNVAHSPGHNAE